MTQHLPPDLLALFEPREPLIYWPPIQEFWWEKEDAEYNAPLTGVGEYMQYFEDPSKAKQINNSKGNSLKNQDNKYSSDDRHNTEATEYDMCQKRKRNLRSKTKRRKLEEKAVR